MKILRQLLSIILPIFVIILVLLGFGSINNRFYRVITVEGNSMSPTLWFGDLIIVTPPLDNIPINSIVLMSVDNELVTHRLIGFDVNGQPITKGDANQINDNFAGGNVNILGVYKFRIPDLGYPFLYLSNFFQWRS